MKYSLFIFQGHREPRAADPWIRGIRQVHRKKDGKLTSSDMMMVRPNENMKTILSASKCECLPTSIDCSLKMITQAYFDKIVNLHCNVTN